MMFADDQQHALPGQGRMKPEQPETTAMMAQLVTDALMMTIWRGGKPGSLLHHSDCGSQYTSEQFQRLMGNVWDNAAMDSLSSSLKTERTARKMYRTWNEAKADLFDYTERFLQSETMALDNRIPHRGVRKADEISLG